MRRLAATSASKVADFEIRGSHPTQRNPARKMNVRSGRDSLSRPMTVVGGYHHAMTPRIVLHFHPGWAFGDGTVLDAIAASGVHRSQWETGTSNVGLTAEVRRYRPSTVSRRMSVVAGYYRLASSTVSWSIPQPTTSAARTCPPSRRPWG